MSFKTLANRIRKDPFAFKLLTQILDNQRETEYASLVEHVSDGKHNALEVARAVGTAVWGGATYTLEGNTSIITGITRVSAGVVRIAFNSGYFSLPISVRLSPMDNAGESVPLLATYTVDSTSQVTVRLWKLAVLGGNTWALTDMHFAVGLHAKPYTPATGGQSAITNPKRGDTLGGAAAGRWNTLVSHQAALRSVFLGEHTSSGAHNAREIAHGWAVVGWSGAAYALTDSSDGVSVSAVSAGVSRLSLPGGYTTPFQVFTQADYDRSGGNMYDITIAVAPRSQITSSKVDVYLYKYDSSLNTWARAQFGYAASIHCTPS